ncbi:lon protease homolog 2, peroxisomal-like [Telopea speciosissima]|uniref:lon protease homolog 2, peroxisomal-like n=1 Tax=Telopea speciosissima TaxID=54955 RepID=UPI001CC547DD|nr:lon protease homolog 2, peroxisomal-like [Telopea speciosissima]
MCTIAMTEIEFLIFVYLHVQILAAHRYGIKRVILPERNLKDLVEVPSAVRNCMEIVLVKRVEDVLEQAFEGGCPWRQRAKL